MTSPEPRPRWSERLTRARVARGDRTTAPQWRLLAPAVFVVAGTLFVASATTADGTDIRAGRITDLAGLAEAETDQLEELRNRQARLVEEVDALSEELEEQGGTTVFDEARQLRSPAGLDPVSGPGLPVTLDDAPDQVIESIDPAVTDETDLIVHQQDIQAVVNALWAGGAEAMSVQGQRVVSTTGIRCVGNTVVLHDVPYAPPYVISAIGPTDTMIDAIDENPFIGFYLEVVQAYQLGWKLEIDPYLEVPGYVGSTTLEHAQPVPTADSAL